MDLMLLETSTGVRSQKGRPRTVPGLPLRLERPVNPSEGPRPRSGLTGVCHCSPELRTPPPNIHTCHSCPPPGITSLPHLALHLSKVTLLLTESIPSACLAWTPNHVIYSQ
uniref:Uncharacterized protein n=1 Tax=Macaca fascicularis TaxID=9541 RepID=A0A7N9CKL3_MACFA